MPLSSRFLPMLLVALLVTTHAACATTMQIESTPSGAEVIYEGKPVGTTPTSLQLPAGGMGSKVELTLKKGNLQKTVEVPRSDIDILGLAAGAGVDAVACAAIGGGGFAASFFFPPCGLMACLAPATFVELPVQLFLFGFQAPKTLSVVLEPAPAKVAPPPIEGTPPPTSNYGY